MKSKLTLIAALLPLLILTACNDSEEVKAPIQSETVKSKSECRSLCGTKMPEFTTVGGNGPTSFEKGMQR